MSTSDSHPWSDPSWTNQHRITSEDNPRANGYIAFLSVSKISKDMGDKEIEEVRKVNSMKFHDNGVHGHPGVYYYLSITEEGVPEIYAGEAGHLGKRAGMPSRMLEKDLVVAIRLKAPIENENIQMDENWRQHLEHLMINDLKRRVDDCGIIIGNSKGEGPSKCVSSERDLIQSFFEKIHEGMKQAEIPGFRNSDQGKWLKLPRIPITLGGPSSRFEVSVNQGFSLPSGQVMICKGARATAGRAAVDIDQQRMKTSLIDSGALEECRWDNGGKPTSYIFTEDCIFPTPTWASRVITNQNHGWEAAGWIPVKIHEN